MALPRPSSPKALWADIRAFTSEHRPYHWVAAFLAVSMPVILIVLFVIDGKTNIEPGAQLIYVESWPANRTDEQIKAEQKVDQAMRDAAKKQRQAEFKKLDERLERIGF